MRPTFLLEASGNCSTRISCWAARSHCSDAVSARSRPLRRRSRASSPPARAASFPHSTALNVGVSHVSRSMTVESSRSISPATPRPMDTPKCRTVEPPRRPHRRRIRNSHHLIALSLTKTRQNLAIDPGKRTPVTIHHDDLDCLHVHSRNRVARVCDSGVSVRIRDTEDGLRPIFELWRSSTAGVVLRIRMRASRSLECRGFLVCAACGERSRAGDGRPNSLYAKSHRRSGTLPKARICS